MAGPPEALRLVTDAARAAATRALSSPALPAVLVDYTEKRSRSRLEPARLHFAFQELQREAARR